MNQKNKFLGKVKMIVFLMIVLLIAHVVIIVLGNGKINALEGYLYSFAAGATSSDATGSNATSSNATGSNATSSNATGSNATSSNATGSNATSSNATSSNATSSNATSSNATSSNATGSNTTGSDNANSNKTDLKDEDSNINNGDTDKINSKNEKQEVKEKLPDILPKAGLKKNIIFILVMFIIQGIIFFRYKSIKLN